MAVDFEAAKQRSLDEAILFLGYTRGKGSVGRPQLLRASRAGGTYAFRWRLGNIVVSVEMDPDTGEFVTIERLGEDLREDEETSVGLISGAWLGALISIAGIGLVIYYLSSTSLGNPQAYLMALIKVVGLAFFYLFGLFWSVRLSRTTRKMPALYLIWFVLALVIAYLFKSSFYLIQIPALAGALVYLILAFAARSANRRRA